MAEDGYKVALNVYDLSRGLARQLSTTFLGKSIEGIWHTGVVVYGSEYYFSGGIQHSPVGRTPYGIPIRVADLGVTHIPKEVFEDYLQEISPRYTAETYSLLTHNCNNFSNEVAQFLVGVTIPDYILQLPNEVMNSPMGTLILPMMQNLETTLRSGAAPQALQFRPATMATNMSNPSPNTSSKEATVNHAKCPVKSNEHSSGNTGETTEKTVVPPAAKTAGSQEEISHRGAPVGDARSKVQEEIMNEFAAIMATGTLRASEAAALATRRVIERYRRLNVAMPRS
ncbi:hypothetical protein NE237_011776 [Protea cynaroides]|uniref:PPPDE domain-containing protein n=1 Tax=Protea cynaroides TaxID=273540 RepID=A0A9Q0JYN7_9MAGN|nr:hypothetical protein NE237_011776 [Protea cynaroides]